MKQEPGGVAARYLHERVRVGDTLDVAAPRGAFLLTPGPGPVVLLSAGVGVTPVLAMLHALAGEASSRPVWWIEGVRNGDEHPFAAEVDDLLRALAGARRHVSYSRPGPADVAHAGDAFDAEGRIGIDAVRRLGVPEDADFYLCGPTAFMDDLTAGLAAWGVPDDRIHTEIFGPGHALTPGVIDRGDHADRAPHPPAGEPGTGPEVSFARSGLTVAWDDRYASLLELAEACDVAVRWSCRTGVCHTCVTGLLAGAVAYDPEPLELPGDDDVLVCCSRPEAPVALDL